MKRLGVVLVSVAFMAAAACGESGNEEEATGQDPPVEPSTTVATTIPPLPTTTTLVGSPPVQFVTPDQFRYEARLLSTELKIEHGPYTASPGRVIAVLEVEVTNLLTDRRASISKPSFGAGIDREWNIGCAAECLCQELPSGRCDGPYTVDWSLDGGGQFLDLPPGGTAVLELVVAFLTEGVGPQNIVATVTALSPTGEIGYEWEMGPVA